MNFETTVMLSWNSAAGAYLLHTHSSAGGDEDVGALTVELTSDSSSTVTEDDGGQGTLLYAQLVRQPGLKFAIYECVGLPRQASFGWARDCRGLEELHVRAPECDIGFTARAASQLVSALRSSVLRLSVHVPLADSLGLCPDIPLYHPNKKLEALDLGGGVSKEAVRVMVRNLCGLREVRFGPGVTLYWDDLLDLMDPDYRPDLRSLSIDDVRLAGVPTRKGATGAELRQLRIAGGDTAGELVRFLQVRAFADLSNLATLDLLVPSPQAEALDLAWITDIVLLEQLALGWMPTEAQVAQLASLAPQVGLVVYNVPSSISTPAAKDRLLKAFPGAEIYVSSEQ